MGEYTAPVFSADSLFSGDIRNGSLSEIKQKTPPFQCGCLFSLTSSLLGRQFTSTMDFSNSPNRYKRHYPVRQTVGTQMADTALLTHRPRFTPAGLLTTLAPRLPAKLQVDPCFPEHTPAEVKQGPYYPCCCCCLELLQAHILSQSLRLPPGSVSQCQKNQAAENSKSMSITGKPSTLRVPSSTPDASVRTSLARV